MTNPFESSPASRRRNLYIAAALVLVAIVAVLLFSRRDDTEGKAAADEHGNHGTAPATQAARPMMISA